MHRNTSSGQAVAHAGLGSIDGCQIINQLKVPANPLHQRQMPRTVLGVLSENEHRHRSLNVDITSTKLAPGVENAIPLTAKSVVPLVPKPCFTIFVEEAQEIEPQTVELSSLEELEANIMKQKFHLLLDGTASPMMMDASLPQMESEDSVTDPDDIATSEYVDDIHHCLRQAEVKHRPKPNYMRKQPDITTAMRQILVDWLVEVQGEYKLCSDTLFLAVNYLDRFLSCMSVLRGKLQLVGTAAILLAAKYEEIYPPDVDEFVYITDDTYSKKQLLRMEHLLLKVLMFDLTVPTTYQFLRQYFFKQNCSAKMEHLAMYMSELTLLEVEPFLEYVPSLIAAAAYCLANYTVNKAFWPEGLQIFTGYTLNDITPCLVDLHKVCLNAPHQPQQAIREKYKTAKYMQVSLLTIPAVLPL